MTVSFKATPAESKLITKIARRAQGLYTQHGVERDLLDIEMDLLAANANGCPLDFERMDQADEFNLMHDISGIYRHIDRDTGKLTGFFLPRFTKREPAAA